MDNKKFEQLITLITNENEEQARALFHDIVVEKSREIYESMMDDEEEDMSEGMGGQVGDLLDEINSEEQGMTEEEEDFGDEEGEEELGDEISLSDEEEGSEFGEEENIEDRVVDLEDKLDSLMAEFETIMNGGQEAGEEDFGDEEGSEDFGDEEGSEDFGDEEEQGEEDMMEAVALQNVKGLYGSKIGGDNGQQTKSTVTANSGQAGMASKPVAFTNATAGTRTVPAPKTIPGTYKNAPGQRKQDLAPATKPTTSQATGVNAKSPVAESRKRK
jgi:hypothetical protein